VAQFDVYKNENSDTSELFPYMLDITNDILHSTKIRVVVPLCNDGASIKYLNPKFSLEGSEFYMSTLDIAGIPYEACGKVVTNVASRRTEIIDALDFLVNGF
jgi:toxin CcdB